MRLSLSESMRASILRVFAAMVTSEQFVRDLHGALQGGTLRVQQLAGVQVIPDGTTDRFRDADLFLSGAQQ